MSSGRHADSHRLRRAAEFRGVREVGGRGWSTPLLVMYVAPNDLGLVRYGITVSGRVGKAVVRNRVRRRLREAMRMRLRHLLSGRDVVLVARPAAAEATWSQLCAALDSLLRRGGMLLPGATETTAACV
ncbi:MAG: ribonuclease P protein component [Chloroflexi bacterium]|nr:ribonuclease P protein component [Chloroflexota bacterium]